jgi:hypothetical protein
MSQQQDEELDIEVLKRKIRMTRRS